MTHPKEGIPNTLSSPRFDAAVRVAKRALAERIAAKTREELKSTHPGARIHTAPIPVRPIRVPPVPPEFS
jgi:hypothetical protein